MTGHRANDKKYGRKDFRYHPRSDEHSKTLCLFVLEDLIAASDALRSHAESCQVVGGTNEKFVFSNGKKKALDLAIGPPVDKPAVYMAPLSPGPIASVRISCEAKQCMTEHGKTKPRIFDELSSSHEIVHQGDPHAIAAGIAVINIAGQFASPLRQTSGDGPPVITPHKQPDVTVGMVEHLRGLLIREELEKPGFDAFCTIVIDCDNLSDCHLHEDYPSPKPGDVDHYQTFIQRIAAAYADRFG